MHFPFDGSDPMPNLFVPIMCLPLLAQLAAAPPEVTSGAWVVAGLGGVAAIIKAVTVPASLRKQVRLLSSANEALRADRATDREKADRHHRECRDEVHTLRGELGTLTLTLRRVLGESPSSFLARTTPTPEETKPDA